MDLQSTGETGAHYILRQLQSFGVTHFFMVPGKLINAFMRCYPNDGSGTLEIEPVVTACETGASYMAEGYARASEKIGVCLVIGGPGVTNALTGIASAYTDHQPVLLLSGQIASSLEMQNVLQDGSQTGVNLCDVFKPITRSALEVKAGQPLPAFLRESVRLLRGVEKGPTYLAVSKEALYEKSMARVDIAPSVLESWSNQALAVEKIKSAAIKAVFKRSTNLVILAGLRCKNAKVAAALVAFSDRFSIPVATTLSAKGLFPEDHPNALGVYGYSGNKRAIEAFKNGVDGVILLGLDTTQWSTMLWSHELRPTCGAIQVDESPDYLGRFLDIDHGVVATGDGFLRLVCEVHAEDLAATQECRSKWSNDLQRVPLHYPVDAKATGNIADHPAAYIPVLQSYFPSDGVVCVDSGSHRSFFGHYWTARGSSAYLSATTLGPMGWSIPAGIGASFARAHGKTMVVTGDGCMLMQGLELSTAAKHGLNIVFVVFNNRSYSASYFNNKDNLPALTQIPDYNWCLFAESLGVSATCVSTPEALHDCIESIMSAARPHLIEIKCDGRHSTPNSEYSSRLKDHPLL